MTEGFTLLLVLVLIYLYDCVIALPRQSVALARPWREWRLRLPDSPLGTARSALLMLQPLPPLGTLHETAPWPLSISEDGICSFSSVSLPGTDRPPQPGKALLFTDVKDVKATDHEIIVNGQMFAVATSNVQASQLSELIRSVSAAPRDKRMELVAGVLDSSFDIETAGEASAVIRARTSGLRIACNVLWVYLYLLCPIVTALFGLTWLIIPLAIGLFAIHIPVVIWFARLHRRLLPGERDARTRQVFSMSLCPPMAIRAVDSVTRHALSLYHPVAAVAALCQKDDAAAFAGALARDLRYPAPIQIEGEAARIESSFRALLVANLRRVMGRRSVPLREAPETRHITAESKSFCPRCLNVFTVPEGVCQDCFNTKLERLPASAKEKP